MKTRSILLASAGFALTAAAAVGGTAALRSAAVAEHMALLERDLRDGDLRVTAVHHERGLLRSSGRFEIALQPGCDAEQGDTPLRASVDYTFDHLGLPTAAMPFTASAMPDGALRDLLRDSLGSRALLSAEGTIGRGGVVDATLKMPELSMRHAASASKVAASGGRLLVSGHRMKLDWRTDRATVRDGDGAFEVRGMSLGLDLSDLRTGIGTMTVGVDQVDTPLVQLEGLSLVTEAALRGDVLDARFAPAVRSLTAGDERLRELALEVSVKGVHAASWETLARLAADSCGFQGMTRAETGQARDATRAMLARGLSVAISRLAATGEKGRVEGEFEFGLEPGGERATRLPVALASHAFARGRLSVGGGLLAPEQREMVLSTGFALERGQSIVASFDYTRGVLSVNGTADRSGAAEQLKTALSGLDELLSATLSGPVGEAAPALASRDAARSPVKVGLPR
jgi:hypothetical protein